MHPDTLLTHLGFVDNPVPVGTHLCIIFTTEKERTDSILKFILSGLARNERVACFSDTLSERTIRNFFAEQGISYDERSSHKALSHSGTSKVYFKDGIFDPERMIDILLNYHTESQSLGFPASRVCGEMNPDVDHIPGGERLMEYEARVSMLLRTHPVTAVCLYDAAAFDGATIMKILKVHPYMLVNGTLLQNPFFIAPEEYLRENCVHG